MTQNKQRPILFNADMVRAILEGRKTQTRRIFKIHCEDDCFVLNEKGFPYRSDSDGSGLVDSVEIPYNCPLGKVGDVLWVRETWCKCYDGLPNDGRPIGDDGWGCLYRATEPEAVSSLDEVSPAVWRPSIHMPRWASRINLEITGVRVERLQDISEEDAKAEGFDYKTYANMGFIGTPKWHYRKFWEQQLNDDNKPDWYGNPWVWVIEFKVKERAGG